MTGSTGSGRVGIAIPRLGVASGVGLRARGLAANTLDVSRIHVVISLPRTSTTLLDRIYTDADPSFTINPDPNADIAATADIQFPLPSGDVAGETFSFFAEVLNSDGVVLYTIGPGAFRVGADGHSLGADGRPGPIEQQATYVGPGSTITSVHIQPRLLTVVVGQTLAVNCTGRTGNPSDTLLVFPFVLWTSNTGIATVENPSDNPSTVRGIAPGITELTCRLEFGSHATDSVRVTVTAPPAPVASVVVTPNPVSLTVGSTQQLVASTLDAAGNTLGRAVTWSTSSSTIAVVSVTGLVTGVAAGSATITATSEGRTGTAIVNVTAVATTGGISGLVQNATNGNPLSGALVEVRAGSATTGPTAAPSVTTTATGAFTFANLAPKDYTVMATATGYASVNVAVTVNVGETKSVTIALPPVSTGISIVLTWGAIPNDLDSYLYVPASMGGGTISFRNLGSCSVTPYACLVNDETTPNSSEFTNITQLGSGTYTFRVNDYINTLNNALSSTDLSRSSARVEVFVGGVLQRTFTVPNQPGVTWTVFDLSGAIAAPTITARNEMAAALPPEFTASALRSAIKAPLKVKKTP